MATTFSTSLLYILIISLLLSPVPCRSTNEVDDFVVDLADHKPVDKKLSHLRLYWHDIPIGRAPTVVQIVKSPRHMPFSFGRVNMFDDPLTLGPELTSKTVGRAQGFYAYASQEEFAILMAMNFYFTYGKYNGSTITIQGRNAVMTNVREMAVVGGSGLFRFASGYAQARTHTFDVKSGKTNVMYDVYVMHY